MRWPLLAGVPDEEVQRLLSVARRRRFARNEVVFHRDDPADSMHLIAKGRFAIRIMTPLGHTATIAVRGAGENFGEIQSEVEVPCVASAPSVWPFSVSSTNLLDASV